MKLKLDSRGLPVCDACGTTFVLDLHAPFADCACGTTEWGDESGGKEFRRIQKKLRSQRE